MNKGNKLHTIQSQRVLSSIEHQALKMWWVAEEVGIHKTTLRRWLRGRIRQVKRTHLERLAKVLACETNELINPSSDANCLVTSKTNA